MNAFISACIKANKEIYDYINFSLKPEDFIYQETLGAGGDKSLNIDLYAESIFIKYLSPFGNIYSEETGYLKSSNSQHQNITIVIDPLDGSDNFSSSMPYYGTSVALQIDESVQIGVVCNLVNRKVYTRDDKQISVTYDLDEKIINDDVLLCGKGKFGLFERSFSYPDICKKLYDEKLKYRSPGAVALSLSCAKYYNFVLFCGSIREFDVKASLYICNDLNIYQTSDLLIVSKNSDIFFKLKNLLNNNRL